MRLPLRLLTPGLIKNQRHLTCCKKLMKNVSLCFIIFILSSTYSRASTPTLAINSYTQDPARTPKGPRLSDPVTTVDGSRGKYRKKHKITNSHSWAYRRKHADTVKPRKSKEKTKSPEPAP
jgi:hypothetical protein